MVCLFFIIVIALVAAWNIWFRRSWGRWLFSELSFARHFAYEGHEAVLTEVVENRGRLPFSAVEVSFQIPKGIVFTDMENAQVSDFLYKRDVYALAGQQRITRRLPVECKKRGHYTVEKVRFKTNSPLYDKIFEKGLEAHTELYVYARRTDVSQIMDSCKQMIGIRQCEKNLFEDLFAFASIREYVPTDPMKTINWKASAKTGELMVNTFESTQTAQVMIYLDVGDEGIIKHPALIEEGISVAASLCERLLRQGMQVGLAVNWCDDAEITEDENVEPGTDRMVTESGTCFPAAEGLMQLESIECTLALAGSGKGVRPYGQLLASDMASPGGALPVFITMDAIHNREAIAEFLGEESTGLWVLPYERGTECPEKSCHAYAVIRREVVPC
ncbi:MAG: DUF58 domain-containing protein [Clostridiales bacterium]|nr:DUF58 domain-containing protein [Clostridiales bacterium]